MISNTVIFSIIAFVIGIGIALAVTASMTKEIKGFWTYEGCCGW